MKISNILSLSLCCFFFLISCKNDTQPKAVTKAPQQEKTMLFPPEPTKNGIHYGWLKNANVYQLNTRQYSQEGNFTGVLQHLKRLRNMGIDIISLTPIFPISQTNKQGTLGNPYAVSDFKAVNPALGTKRDFKILVDSIHSLRMKVLLDFPVASTGRDCKWLSDHADWFSPREYGNDSDIVALNYKNKDLNSEMMSCMEYWVDQFKIDGYTMHEAGKVPNDFWAQASSQLLSKKQNVLLISDAETSDHVNNNYFHASYNAGFYQLSNAIAKGNKRAKDIEAWYAKNQKQYKNGWPINYTSNYDKNTTEGSVFDNLGDASKCMAALAMTFDGMPLIYGGQEEPLRKGLKPNEKDPIPFNSYKYEDFYTRMLQVKHINTALWNGRYGVAPTILHADNQIFAFEKNNKGNEVFCLFNLSDKAAEYEMHKDYMQWESVAAARRFDVVKGQKINLAPWSFRVVTNR